MKKTGNLTLLSFHVLSVLLLSSFYFRCVNSNFISSPFNHFSPFYCTVLHSFFPLSWLLNIHLLSTQTQTLTADHFRLTSSRSLRKASAQFRMLFYLLLFQLHHAQQRLDPFIRCRRDKKQLYSLLLTI